MSTIESTIESALSVSATLVKLQDQSEILLAAPSKVSYSFNCSPQGGEYEIIINHKGKLIRKQVSIPLPRHFVKELTPYKVIYTNQEVEVEGCWRLAIDKQRNLYFTENNRANSHFNIRTQEGAYSRVRCKDINLVRGIAVDVDKDGAAIVYITGDHKLQKYVNGCFQREIGTETKSVEVNSFHDPNGIRVHSSGSVYVCDSGNGRVQAFSSDLSGTDTRVIGANRVLLADEETTVLEHPEDLDFDLAGNMFVVDSGNYSVVVFSSASDYSSVQWRISLSRDPGVVYWPVSLRVFRDGVFKADYFCVSDFVGNCITVFSVEGEFIRRVSVCGTSGGGYVQLLVEGDRKSVDYVPPALSATKPVGVAVDCDGFIYIACCDTKEIQVFQ